MEEFRTDQSGLTERVLIYALPSLKLAEKMIILS